MRIHSCVFLCPLAQLQCVTHTYSYVSNSLSTATSHMKTQVSRYVVG